MTGYLTLLPENETHYILIHCLGDTFIYPQWAERYHFIEDMWQRAAFHFLANQEVERDKYGPGTGCLLQSVPDDPLSSVRPYLAIVSQSLQIVPLAKDQVQNA